MLGFLLRGGGWNDSAPRMRTRAGKEFSAAPNRFHVWFVNRCNRPIVASLSNVRVGDSGVSPGVYVSYFFCGHFPTLWPLQPELWQETVGGKNGPVSSLSPSSPGTSSSRT